MLGRFSGSFEHPVIFWPSCQHPSAILGTLGILTLGSQPSIPFQTLPLSCVTCTPYIKPKHPAPQWLGVLTLLARMSVTHSRGRGRTMSPPTQWFHLSLPPPFPPALCLFCSICPRNRESQDPPASSLPPGHKGPALLPRLPRPSGTHFTRSCLGSGSPFTLCMFHGDCAKNPTASDLSC